MHRLASPSRLLVSLLTAICAAASVMASEPAAAASDRGFAEGTTSTTLPIELAGDRIYLTVRLDGQPLRMLVDTGGVNILDPGVAQRLGLRNDAALSRDAGVAAVRGSALELGEFTLRDPVFYAVDLGRLPQVDGIAFDGVLGFEVFERSVVTLNYATQQLTLGDPAGAGPAGTRLPFRLDERLPLIEAQVDGHRGDFTLEVGARGPLTLYGAFVRQHAMLDAYPHGHEQVVDWSIGGPRHGFSTRIAKLELAGVVVPQLVAHLQAATRDAAGARQVAGSIGGGVLKRFTVTLDFVRRELILEPNAALAALEPFDRSGMWINLDGEDLIIDALQPNGPGARSQLQPHDRLINIDGVPVTQLTLAAVRRKFSESAAGTRVKVTARRDSKVIYATIVLADLVPNPSAAQEPRR